MTMYCGSIGILDTLNVSHYSRSLALRQVASAIHRVNRGLSMRCVPPKSL